MDAEILKNLCDLQVRVAALEAPNESWYITKTPPPIGAERLGSLFGAPIYLDREATGEERAAWLEFDFIVHPRRGW